jgi:hypothetical protein
LDFLDGQKSWNIVPVLGLKMFPEYGLNSDLVLLSGQVVLAILLSESAWLFPAR